jgi:hypothetical protein
MTRDRDRRTPVLVAQQRIGMERGRTVARIGRDNGPVVVAGVDCPEPRRREGAFDPIVAGRRQCLAEPVAVADEGQALGATQRQFGAAREASPRIGIGRRRAERGISRPATDRGGAEARIRADGHPYAGGTAAKCHADNDQGTKQGSNHRADLDCGKLPAVAGPGGIVKAGPLRARTALRVRAAGCRPEARCGTDPTCPAGAGLSAR